MYICIYVVPVWIYVYVYIYTCTSVCVRVCVNDTMNWVQGMSAWHKGAHECGLLAKFGESRADSKRKKATQAMCAALSRSAALCV